MNTIAILITLALAATGLSAADKNVQMKDLPAPVQKTVQAEEAKGAKIVSLSPEVEGGKTMDTNGKKTEVAVNAAGKSVKP